MKQPKRINFKMLLIAVLALVIAFALVACNGDKKDKSDNNNNNSENMEMTEASKQLIEQSRSDFDAMFNYFLTRSETISAGEGISFLVNYVNSNLTDNIVGEHALCGIEINDSEVSVHVYVFEKEDDAKAVVPENEQPDEYDMIRIDNKLIENYTLYQQIVGATRPTSITKFTTDQVEFMESKLHRGLGKKEAYTHTLIGFYPDDFSYGYTYGYNELLSGNCEASEGILHENLAGYEEEAKSTYYTSDSFVRFDEVTGLVHYKFTFKPGWGTTEIKNNNNQPTGKYGACYFYDDVPATITVPTKLDGHDISEAEINISDHDTIGSVIIEKEFDKVYLSGKIKQITIPVSDKAFVEIEDNTALETINFGGTTQQWEELYGRSAQKWTHVWTHVYDQEQGKSVYVDITFTVVCTNGSITYPKTNA